MRRTGRSRRFRRRRNRSGTLAGREIAVLYFAWLRERIGRSEERVSLPDGVDRIDALILWLAGRGPGYAAAFERPAAVRCAVNQEVASPDALIGPGDEVAFFPPVTGG